METEIIELEKKYWQGMEDHDYETVKGLTHFPCIVAGKNGVRSVDEDSFKKMFDSGAGANIKVVDISGFESQRIGETVILAYLISTKAPAGSQGAIKCACSSTWVRENSVWRCALHTETELAG